MSELTCHCRDLLKWLLQVGVHVDGQRLERAQIHHLRHALDVLAGLVFPIQGVDRREEPGERLSGAGWRADERVPAGYDRRPTSGLGFGRTLRKSSLEPQPNRRMKPREISRRTRRVVEEAHM